MPVTYRPGPRAVILAAGNLDDVAAAELDRILDLLVADPPQRLVVDLRGLTSFTDAGAAALSACLQHARSLERGVGMHVATEAGRRALLASMALV